MPDGRRARIRKRGNKIADHTALNVLLQTTGSLVMKHAHMIAENEAVRLGIIKDVKDFPSVAHQHDECQQEVNESEVESISYVIEEKEWKSEEKRVFIDDLNRMWSAPSKEKTGDNELLITRKYHPLGEIYARSITKIGEIFKLRIRTDGEYKIGKSWADTH